MSTRSPALRVVGSHAMDGDGASRPDDLGLTTLILVVAVLPLALAAAGHGPRVYPLVGRGTVGVILAGRELLAALLARARIRRAP
jgi:hypothetical protein